MYSRLDLSWECSRSAPESLVNVSLDAWMQGHMRRRAAGSTRVRRIIGLCQGVGQSARSRQRHLLQVRSLSLVDCHGTASYFTHLPFEMQRWRRTTMREYISCSPDSVRTGDATRWKRRLAKAGHERARSSHYVRAFAQAGKPLHLASNQFDSPDFIKLVYVGSPTCCPKPGARRFRNLDEIRPIDEVTSASSARISML